MRRFTDEAHFEQVCDQARISERQRAILRVHWLEGLDSEQTAERLGMSRAGVLSASGRATRRIRDAQRRFLHGDAVVTEDEPEYDDVAGLELVGEDGLTYREHGETIRDAMRGHGKAHPPLDTEDQWGRSVGLRTSPLVSTSDIGKIARLADYQREDDRELMKTVRRAVERGGRGTHWRLTEQGLSWEVPYPKS